MVTYKCMKCFAEMSVSKQRELRMDGRNCFLCKGPIQKVENKKSVGSFTVDIDCSDALKGLKAVQREAKKATAALKELEEQKKRNTFLVIELDNEDSTLPKVFHEGKEITNKVRVHFDWKTRTDYPGKLEVNVDHYELNDNGEPNLTGIEIERLT